MIGRQRSPEQTMNKTGIQSNGLGYASIEVNFSVDIKFLHYDQLIL